MEMDWDALFAAGADIVDVVVLRCCTYGWRGRWLWIGRRGNGRVEIGRREANATGSCWADHVNFCLVTEAGCPTFSM